MTRLGELDLKDAAKEAAGNWQHFKCFVWYRDPEPKKPEDWSIVYTHNRDSRLLDQSNAAVIRKAMLPFTEGDDPDVVMESHSHWAVGHVDAGGTHQNWQPALSGLGCLAYTGVVF